MQVQRCRYRGAGTKVQVQKCRYKGSGTEVQVQWYRGAGAKVHVQRCRTWHLQVSVEPVIADRQVRGARGPVHPLALIPPPRHDPWPKHLGEELHGGVGGVHCGAILMKVGVTIMKVCKRWVVPVAKCSSSTSWGQERPVSQAAPPPPASCW